uniref:Uncharacterized protein n=1 Tax=Arundo donax TaxID=35708 RepID=A0A0A9FX85_ARUDO
MQQEVPTSRWAHLTIQAGSKHCCCPII